MLIKRRPPNSIKYRHEHVMITNLYIICHILQGIFCPSLDAEFQPHSQSKIATFFPQYHVCFFPTGKSKKKKKNIYFFFRDQYYILMRNNDPYQNQT